MWTISIHQPPGQPFFIVDVFIFPSYPMIYWLVVATHLNNISQNGSLPQVGMKIKKYLKSPSRFRVSFLASKLSLSNRVAGYQNPLIPGSTLRFQATQPYEVHHLPDHIRHPKERSSNHSSREIHSLKLT